MNIKSFSKFDPEQYTLFNTDEGRRFIEQLNGVLQNHTQALQGQLSLLDNFNAELKTFAVLNDATYDVVLSRLRWRVREARVLDPDLYDYSEAAWTQINDKQVRVKVSFASAPADPVPVSLLFMGS